MLTINTCYIIRSALEAQSQNLKDAIARLEEQFTNSANAFEKETYSSEIKTFNKHIEQIENALQELTILLRKL
jgi:uncharacterized protein YukE